MNWLIAVTFVLFVGLFCAPFIQSIHDAQEETNRMSNVTVINIYSNGECKSYDNFIEIGMTPSGMIVIVFDDKQTRILCEYMVDKDKLNIYKIYNIIEESV